MCAEVMEREILASNDRILRSDLQFHSCSICCSCNLHVIFMIVLRSLDAMEERPVPLLPSSDPESAEPRGEQSPASLPASRRPPAPLPAGSSPAGSLATEARSLPRSLSEKSRLREDHGIRSLAPWPP